MANKVNPVVVRFGTGYEEIEVGEVRRPWLAAGSHAHFDGWKVSGDVENMVEVSDYLEAAKDVAYRGGARVCGGNVLSRGGDVRISMSLMESEHLKRYLPKRELDEAAAKRVSNGTVMDTKETVVESRKRLGEAYRSGLAGSKGSSWDEEHAMNISVSWLDEMRSKSSEEEEDWEVRELTERVGMSKVMPIAEPLCDLIVAILTYSGDGMKSLRKLDNILESNRRSDKVRSGYKGIRVRLQGRLGRGDRSETQVLLHGDVSFGGRNGALAHSSGVAVTGNGSVGVSVDICY